MILGFDRFGQSTVAIFAREMRVQPVDLCVGNVIALTADPFEMRWTKGVHSFDPFGGHVRWQIGVRRRDVTGQDGEGYRHKYYLIKTRIII